MAKKFRVFPVDGYSYETTYREYIKSADWRLKADQFKAAKNYTCEKCGYESEYPDYVEPHVHHKHYNTLGRERQEDVMVLCELCHKTMHPGWFG